MRILMVMLEGRGGMFQYGALLANALSNEHEVFAIVPRPSEPVFIPAVRVTQLAVGDTRWRFLVNTVNVTRLYHFVREIHRIGPEIIHFHNPYSPWTVLALPWLRKYAKVTTIPEGVLHRGMEKRVEMRIARNMHAKAVDALIVLCEFDRFQAREYAPSKSAFIIPHGINTLFLDAMGSASPHLTEDSVLFFGGIAPFKGLEYVLKAFVIVQQKMPDARLVIAGRGSIAPYQEMLARVRNLELDNRFIPMDKAAEYFRRAKFLVMPYIEDDHSGIIPVAYAFGKPVIVSEKVSDMVEDGRTGLIVPARDHIALAEAMTRLLLDEQLRIQMGKRAIEKAESELNWDGIAERTLQVYAHARGIRKEHFADKRSEQEKNDNAGG